jgi:hypothetical protein
MAVVAKNLEIWHPWIVGSARYSTEISQPLPGGIP